VSGRRDTFADNLPGALADHCEPAAMGNELVLRTVVLVVRIRVPCVPGSTAIRRRGRSFG
jgi:hypothetical protein